MTEKFVVRHYVGDERPIIKGNGFDGLEIGSSREEAEEFIAWVNARLPSIALIGLPVIDPQMLEVGK